LLLWSICAAATKPSTDAGRLAVKPAKHDFKMAADGRLIITDDSMQQGLLAVVENILCWSVEQ
jgi:hypothetical protein